jgi:hypothetical protein
MLFSTVDCQLTSLLGQPLYQEKRCSVMYPSSLLEEPVQFLAKLLPSTTHLRMRVCASVGGTVFSSRPHFGPEFQFNFLRQSSFLIILFTCTSERWYST